LHKNGHALVAITWPSCQCSVRKLGGNKF